MSLLAAPTGLVCALLLSAIPPVVNRNVYPLNPMEERSQSLDIQRALTSVQATMVELPDPYEARAIAKSASRTRVLELQNQHLAAAVHKLEARYASLQKTYETNLAKQQVSLDHVQSELIHLQDQQKTIIDGVGTLVFDHNYDTLFKEPARYSGLGGDHPDHRSGLLELAPDKLTTLVSALGNDLTSNSEDGRSWISDARVSALPSPVLPALQIARALESSRREAIQSKQEQKFTIDVEKRIFGTNPGREFIQIDPVLELSLDTASSELINEHSGNIRFFPDGSSTGGRIQLHHGSAGALVQVDWSTGAVTVQEAGN